MKKRAPKKGNPKTSVKKVVASLPEHTNEDVKRYIGFVAENFQDKVSAVAEQFLGLNGKVDSLTDVVGELKVDMTQIKNEMHHVHRVLDAHTEMIGAMMEDIEVVKSNVELLKSGMRIKVDYPDFEALEKRVRLLETKSHR